MTFELHRPTLADLKKEQPLNTAEKKLIAGCKTGEMVVLGGSVPKKSLKKNTIRAELIRYLLLGGCKDARPHPKGVQLHGAWISGVLDFEACKTPLELGVITSHFAETPVLDDCELGQLWLNGSHLPGLNAQRMRVERNVLLGQGFHAEGLVDLTGSAIKGQLNCEGGIFRGKAVKSNPDEPTHGPALMAQGLDVGGSVFLNLGFSADGLVDLTGSVIKGQLVCDGGSFDGDFCLQDVRVTGPFIWLEVRGDGGSLDLTDAHVGAPWDDLGSWQLARPHDIGGFRYGALKGVLDVQRRLDWLDAA